MACVTSSPKSQCYPGCLVFTLGLDSVDGVIVLDFRLLVLRHLAFNSFQGSNSCGASRKCCDKGRHPKMQVTACRNGSGVRVDFIAKGP